MKIDVEGVGGLDNALSILGKGLVVLNPESPFFGAKIKERDMPPLASGRRRRAPFFVSPAERRRKKKFAAAKRARRREWKVRRFFHSDPKEYWALKEFEDIKNAAQELKDLHFAIFGERKEETDGTALIIIRRRRRGIKQYLTIVDKLKGGKTGFIGGGIRPGKTLQEEVCREVEEEVGLQVRQEVEKFHEINVSHSYEPYMMYGVLVEKFSGRMREGVEIESGSLAWCVASEIDQLIMERNFVSNHADFWNVLCAQEEQEEVAGEI